MCIYIFIKVLNCCSLGNRLKNYAHIYSSPGIISLCYNGLLIKCFLLTKTLLLSSSSAPSGKHLEANIVLHNASFT